MCLPFPMFILSLSISPGPDNNQTMCVDTHLKPVHVRHNRSCLRWDFFLFFCCFKTIVCWDTETTKTRLYWIHTFLPLNQFALNCLTYGMAPTLVKFLVLSLLFGENSSLEFGCAEGIPFESLEADAHNRNCGRHRHKSESFQFNFRKYFIMSYIRKWFCVIAFENQTRNFHTKSTA